MNKKTKLLLEENPKDLKILTTPSDKWDFVFDSGLDTLAGRMTGVLYRHMPPGVGLSANQIGVLKQVFIMQLGKGKKLHIYVNPVLISSKGRVRNKHGELGSVEGCLSRPGKQETVDRYKNIILKWQTQFGDFQVKRFTGLKAIIIQHELDHMKGVLI